MLKAPPAPPRPAARRAQFLLESVAALKGALRGVGSDLIVAVGRPEEVIPGALEGAGALHLAGF